jgi:hypothetical protein
LMNVTGPSESAMLIRSERAEMRSWEKAKGGFRFSLR